MRRPLIFLDTETLGLGLGDPIWEIALIRRETDGTETQHHWHLLAWSIRDVRLTAPVGFPDQFRHDFERRYGASAALTHPADVGDELARLFMDHPTIVGAVPSFDTERIAHQLGVSGWHHRLRCVETLTAGHLGRDVGGLTDCAEALGIPTDDAHTAMGDVRMVRAIWDRIMGRAEQ